MILLGEKQSADSTPIRRYANSETSFTLVSHGRIPRHTPVLLFERSKFLIDTSQKKNPSVCVCVCSTNLGFSVEKDCLGFSVGISECLVPAKKNRTPGTSERFVANCGVGLSTRRQGDSASLVKPTQDKRR